MKKVDIVILQYNNLEETKKCVDSLQQLNWEHIDYHFIIVDNASINGCGKELFALYGDIPYITVLLSEKNLGFAKGNNLGILYAQEHHHPDLIAVSNNDIEIQDRDFFQKLVSLYKQEPFAVCGPDIYSVIKQYHQSPIRTQPYTLAQLKGHLANIDRKLRYLYLIRKLRIYELLRFVKKLLGKSQRADAPDYDRVQKNVVIQGAFFILSQRYLLAYPDGLFPETFMYMEEDILAYRCLKKALPIIYFPELQVLHYEGAATRKASKSRVDKYIFELENTIKSSVALIELMQESIHKGEQSN